METNARIPQPNHDAFGVHSFGRVEYEIRDGEVVYMDRGSVRVMVTEQHVGPATEPTLRDLSEALIAVCGWADRVQLIDAKYDGVWELSALGAVTAPIAVLIRPNGHVAWVGNRHPLGLPDALTTWFGPPTAA